MFVNRSYELTMLLFGDCKVDFRVAEDDRTSTNYIVRFKCKTIQSIDNTCVYFLAFNEF